jgi:hypothetical protein
VNGIIGYTPVPGDDGLCVYQIKSNLITLLNETPNSTPPTAVFTAKANLQDVTRPTALSVAGNLLCDVAEPGANKDALGIQVSDGTNGLWLSNNWTGTTTYVTSTVPVIQGGDLQVH